MHCKRLIVQFIHPGGEHRPDNHDHKDWNAGPHRRKFLISPGRYIAEGLRLPDGIRAQTEQTLSNMRRVLEALGLSMGRVMSVRVFLTRFKRDYEAMNEVYATYFGDPAPARSTVAVAELPLNALVEIECIALVDEILR